MKFKNWMAVVALIGVGACGGEETGDRVELGAEAPQGRETWSPELTQQIDAANAAYAAGNYEEASEIFQSITEDYPELGVAYFGVYMAESAMGNEEAAQAALAEAEARNPGLGRMHDAATDTSKIPIDGGMDMPQGHPNTGMPQGHPPVQQGTDGDAMQPMGSGGE